MPWLLRVAIRSPGTTTVSWPSTPPVLTSASGQPPSSWLPPSWAVAVRQVPALDQHRGAGLGREPLALFQRPGPVRGGRFAQQHGQLGQVRGDEVRQREQGPQRGLGRFLQQPVAARRHHHRVQDHDAGAHLFEPGPDGVDHRVVAEHADLDGVDGDVVADRLQLGRQEGCRRHMHGPDAPGVLGGQRRDGSHPVAAVRGDALQVGLDAGAAGGVRARDGQHPRNPRRGGGCRRRAPGRRTAGRLRFGWMPAGSMQAGSWKTRDIPSPVLTGQVQRVWISAGSMRGTPCQSPSLAFPAASLLHVSPVAGPLTTRGYRPGST